MRPMPMQVLSVADAATMLEVAPRTVRRWLQEGRLEGMKLGTSWAVLCPAADGTSATRTRGAILHRRAHATPTIMRQRLRQLGARLITVGNAMAAAHRAPGKVFVTWRRPGRLQLTFAIGRTSPTRGWAPRALGIELPFWVQERQQWRQVQRLLRRYEQLRCWCHPRLLPIAEVQKVVEAEIHRVHTAVEAFAAHKTPLGERQMSRADDACLT